MYNTCQFFLGNEKHESSNTLNKQNKQFNEQIKSGWDLRRSPGTRDTGHGTRDTGGGVIHMWQNFAFFCNFNILSNLNPVIQPEIHERNRIWHYKLLTRTQWFDSYMYPYVSILYPYCRKLSRHVEKCQKYVKVCFLYFV